MLQSIENSIKADNITKARMPDDIWNIIRLDNWQVKLTEWKGGKRFKIGEALLVGEFRRF